MKIGIVYTIKLISGKRPPHTHTQTTIIVVICIMAIDDSNDNHMKIFE